MAGKIILFILLSLSTGCSNINGNHRHYIISSAEDGEVAAQDHDTPSPATEPAITTDL